MVSAGILAFVLLLHGIGTTFRGSTQDDDCHVGSGWHSHRSLYWFVSCVAVAPERADDAPQERMQPPPLSSVSASPSGLHTAMTTAVR